MNLKSIIPLLTSKHPHEILEKVIAHNALVDVPSKLSTLRIIFSSGTAFEGIPVKMDADGNIILTSQDKSISYLSTSNLVGVEILNPDSLLDVLTDGAYFEVPEENVPTNLELKREVKSFVDGAMASYNIIVVSDIKELGITTDVQKYQLAQFLKILQEILVVIAEDNLGKMALDDLQTLQIDSGEVFSVAKTGNQIKLSVNFKHKFSIDFKSKLYAALESKI